MADPLTTNVWLRVLLIRTPSGMGTAFSMDIDGRQYLITAKHVVASLTGKQRISFRENGAWSPIDVTIYPCNDPIDIAVLIPPRVMTVTHTLDPIGTNSVFVTQDVYFVGFPFGSTAQDKSAAFGLRPMPFAKRGILAEAPVDNRIRIDAFNNRGFSGAPIVFPDQKSRAVFYVLGVVSGFQPDLVAVTNPEPVKPGEDVSKLESWRIRDNGKTILKDTEQLVPLNSGILIGYSIQPAVEMIRKYSNGPEISKS